MKGENERLLFQILNDAYPGKWESDKSFLDERKFRGDAINRKDKIVIEINGGIWMQKGAHNTGLSMMRDMEKYNLAVLNGWKVLLYTPQTLRLRPWTIIRDVRTLCGASADINQKLLCFDDACISTKTQVQQRL